MSAVAFTSMSARFCSIGPEPMPAPTMLRKAVTRVLEVSMTRLLKSSKFRQPELPASDTVVTQLGSVWPSGKTLQSPPA